MMEPRVRKRFAAAIVVAGSLIVGAFVAEIVVRIVAPQILSLPWPVVNGIRVAEPDARGFLTVRHQFSTAVHMSSQRFRDEREFSPQAQPGRTRIAVIGDSFVFGWGVEARESFPATLEAMLRSRGHDVEVINAGVPGQSFGEKAIWYRDAVARFHPQLVVAELLYDDHDRTNGVRAFELRDGVAVPVVSSVTARREGLRSRWYSLPLYAWLSQHSHAFALLKRAIAVVIGRQMHQQALAAHSKGQVVELPLMEAEVAWLNGEVARSGGRLVIVALPVRELIYGERTAGIIESHVTMSNAIAVLCAREGIPYTDLTPQIREVATHDPRELYYSGSEEHPNARGYRAFAEAFAAFAEERQLAGPALASSK
jgi:lysophospholipase L1-like esterase